MDATATARGPSVPAGISSSSRTAGSSPTTASRDALLADFEYVGEATCIIDRSATAYRLELDGNRHLRLGPPLGVVEFHWLRQALADARQVHPEGHRLQRAETAGLAELVAGLFETLQLEHGTDADLGLWSLEIDGLSTRRNALADVDLLLAGNARLESVRVTDPFGHHVPAGMAPKTPAPGPRGIPQLHRNPCTAQDTRA